MRAMITKFFVSADSQQDFKESASLDNELFNSLREAQSSLKKHNPVRIFQTSARSRKVGRLAPSTNDYDRGNRHNDSPRRIPDTRAATGS